MEIAMNYNIPTDVTSLNYEMFGAIGDGVTDDTEAMRACHSLANEKKIPVVLSNGKKYYVPPMTEEIVIKTDVDFKDCLFIIDDLALTCDDPRSTVSIFSIRSYYEPHIFDGDSDQIKAINESSGLATDTKRIDLRLGYPALLRIENENSRRFIRYGANKNSGNKQTEVVLVDSDGYIDPQTPIVCQFDAVTKIIAYRADDKPLTVKGGIFNLRANHDKSSYKYFGRNMPIFRSNTTIDSLTYVITDEPTGKHASQPYSSFLRPDSANNVKIVNCRLDAHRTYWAIGSGGVEVGMGQKSISAQYANSVKFINCIQTNMFNEDGNYNSELWGIMSSSYCKNLSYEGCVLSRFDAHSGVYNAEIKNSKVGLIRIVGHGTLKIEDSEFYAINKGNTVISTREDYGSFWKGKIIIKNLLAHTQGDNDVTLISGHWYNHNFGYEVRFADEIIVENFDIDDKRRDVILFAKNFCRELEGSLLPEIDGKPNINPAKPPKRIIIRNKNKNVRFVIPDKNEYKFFADTEFDIEL